MDRRQILLGVSLLLALVVIRLHWDPYPVQAVRLAYFDTLQRIAPREYQPAPVRVIDIDEASLAEFGQWPWPRDILADLVLSLQRHGASVVAFDVIFAEADRYSPSTLVERNVLSVVTLPEDVRAGLQAIDFDAEFAASFRQMPVVLGTAHSTEASAAQPMALVDVVDFGDGLMDALPPLSTATPLVPALRETAAGIGGINVAPQADASVVRTVPLVWNTGAGALPSLAVEALRVALQEESIILWGDERAPGTVDAIGVGSFDIPTLNDGQLWVRFRPNDPDLYVSAKDVLTSGGVHPDLVPKLEGHVVFVGTSAAGLLDIRTTALGEAVPGVSIHAQIVEQIVLGQYLTRADWVQGVEVWAMVLVGLLVGHRMIRSGPALSFATGFGCAALIASGSWLAFSQYNLLIDASYPLIAGFVAFAIMAGYQFIVADRDKRELRRSFSRYVAPTVLQQIEDSDYALELGGEIRPVTVMFCDVRNFTPISERYSAGELVSFLNDLFDRLSRAILRTEGTIDKFIGDSVMAFWNAPLPIEDHATRAVEAALGMRRALAEFNADNSDIPPVRLAIGVSTGEVCVGNIGSADRFDYSVIGDNVNVTARLEAACRAVGCDILISDASRTDPARFACLYAGALTLKGVSASVPAWMVCGDAARAASPEFAALEDAFETWRAMVERGGAAEGDGFEALRQAAHDFDPALDEFVAKLPARRADYALPRPVQDTAA